MNGITVSIPFGASILAPAFEDGGKKAIVAILFESEDDAIMFYESVKQAIIDESN